MIWLEPAVAAYFLFQVEFFLCELVLEFRNFVVGQCVFNCDCYLTGRQVQEIDIFW